ncbi:hypothetical protein EDD16DRAFT_59761 [Pisolithus croceorrhizus]|nr:hypothetical protein EDD16DRAFT_59761 [Pisolithus croceorrhizus]
MPIKHFDNYLTERKHLQTLSLNVLADSRLGIDAHYYLKQLAENLPSREPLLAATGGLPLALTTRIETDLRTLEKLRIKPVFVFPWSPPCQTLEATATSGRLGRGMQGTEGCVVQV